MGISRPKADAEMVSMDEFVGELEYCVIVQKCQATKMQDKNTENAKQRSKRDGEILSFLHEYCENGKYWTSDAFIQALVKKYGHKEATYAAIECLKINSCLKMKKTETGHLGAYLPYNSNVFI